MDYLSAYRDYLRDEKGASDNTLSSYLRDMRQFAEYVEERGISLRQVIRADIENYEKYLTLKGKSVSTVTRAAASIKSFYNFMLARGLVEKV